LHMPPSPFSVGVPGSGSIQQDPNSILANREG
jgi:hypothetical protein